MPFFTKSSLLFILVNIVRLLSLVAIGLALSGEIVLIVDNIKGVNASLALSLSASSSATTSAAAATLTATSSSSHSPVRSSMDSPSSFRMSRTKREKNPGFVEPTATASAAIVEPMRSTPGYVGSTDIPQQVGGPLFFVAANIFLCILLLVAFIAEFTPPIRFFVITFWLYTFPGFGEDYGVGPLGFFQVFVGCTILSHAVQGLPSVGGWFVFVMGFVNMAFGVMLSHRIKSIRSIFASPGSATLSGLQIVRSNGQEVITTAVRPRTGGAHPSNSSFKSESNSSISKNGLQGIHIGAPRTVQFPPPSSTYSARR